MTLSASGRIEVRYGTSANSSLRRLVGITPGGGAVDPGETDLSGAGALPASGTTYEYFDPAELDLDNHTLTFLP